MDDLIVVVLGLVILALGVGIGLALTAIAGPVVAICVFGAAAHAFFVTLGRGILHRGGEAAVSGPDEPAFVAYYRSQVWRDLKLATRTGWHRALDEAERIRAMVPRSTPGQQPTLGEALLVYPTLRMALALYGYIGLVLAAILMAAVSVVPTLPIALVSAGAWVSGAPLRVFERLRRERGGTHFDCPVCHDRFALATYICHGCAARHWALAPNRYGVLHHRCTCGVRLPALGLLGRERLTSVCPENNHLLGEGVGSVRTFHVPVAGGPSTGKSTFLAAALLGLEQSAADGTLATSVQSSSMDAYDRLLDGFRRGVLPPKTVDLQAPAVVAEVRGRASSVLLYAYDVAGEAYGSEDELRRDSAYGLAEGVVLLVDPFALDQVRTDLADEIAATPQLGASSEAPQRMLERLIGVLQEQGMDLARLPAAICVTKTDALGIGDAIAAAPGANDGGRTRAWLEAQGAGNFLRAAEMTFREIACFSVSALGRSPGTGFGAFAPVGTLEPLMWLLARAGVHPALPGEVQPTQSETLAGAPLTVTPKRPLLRAPINALTPFGYAGNLAVGAAAFLLMSLAPLGVLLSARSGQAEGPGPPPPTALYDSDYAYSLRIPDRWSVDREDEVQADGDTVISRWSLNERASFKVRVTGSNDYLDPGDLARSARDPYLGGGASDYRQVDWRPDQTLGAWRWRFRLDARGIEKIVWFFTPQLDTEDCDNEYTVTAAAPPGEFDDHLKAFEAAIESISLFGCE